MSHNAHVEVTKHVADGIAGIAVLGTIFDHLPEIAAGCAILWYILRFFEYGRTVYKRYKGKDNGKEETTGLD